MNTNTGNYVVLGSTLVYIASKFGILVDDNTATQIIVGLLALYGVIHQWVITRKLKAMAVEAGVKGLN